MEFPSVFSEYVLLPLGNKEAASAYGRSTYNPALLQTLNNPVASVFQDLYFQALGFLPRTTMPSLRMLQSLLVLKF